MSKAKKRDSNTGSADITSFFKLTKKSTNVPKPVKSDKVCSDSDSNTEEISSSPIIDEPSQKKRKIITYSKKNKDTPESKPITKEDFDSIDDDSENPFSVKRTKLAPAPVKKVKKAEQLCIDVGQKGFGATTCDECGMLYVPGKHDDELLHSKFHKQSREKQIEFPGWKNERVIKLFPSEKSRIIVIEDDDAPQHLKKVEGIRTLIDRELGAQGVEHKTDRKEKIFLYIMNKKAIGCVITEAITTGFPLIPSDDDQDSSIRCSKVGKPAVCGISRIWVNDADRRRGIATKMLEAVRSNFVYGCTIAKEELAFTQPTPDGKNFFTKYIGIGDFLVYSN